MCIRDRVSFVIEEKEYDCTRGPQGGWNLLMPFSTGFHFVQLMLDGTEVLTPLLPIGYGYSRPYNYVSLDGRGEDFYRLKEVPHGKMCIRDRGWPVLFSLRFCINIKIKATVIYSSAVRCWGEPTNTYAVCLRSRCV